ncbi:MAG: diacylglycerol kinase family protein, partial [Myxococcota bacterium]
MAGSQDGEAEDAAVLVVFNPAAGGGRAARWRPLLRRALDDAPTTVHWVESEGRGHAEALVRQWRAGVSRVVAIGGDGTVHEAVNGLLDVDSLDEPGPRGSRVALGVVHLGTGGDFRRGLGTPQGWREQLELALTGRPVSVDVLVVELQSVEGQPIRRISANVAGAGMNGRVVELANDSTKEWGGLATFAWATVRAVVERPLADAVVVWRDAEGREQHWQGRLAASFFANGPYCGNG